MKTYPDFSKCKVLVIGDVMLDRYYWGKVSRISPEAPVPVVRVMEKTGTLGGAGNVALNLAELKCQCALLGVYGNDPPGESLISILNKFDIQNRLIKSSTRPTTTKTRIISQGQQIIRLDEEETGKLENCIYKELIRRFDEQLAGTDVVIISDYGKGVLDDSLTARIINLTKKNHIPIFVDPKGENWNRYNGATCITPNLTEFNQVSPVSVADDLSLSQEAKKVIDQFELDFLLVTKGAKGLSLFGRSQPDTHISAIAKEVFDVSGAGDTVIATLSAAFGTGLKMAEAAELANLAAGIVVGKIGTQPITTIELEGAFYDKGISGANKIFTIRQAKELIAKWHNEGKRIVFTNGCFDILHIGHIKLLHAASEEGDKLIIGLNSDSSIKRLKGPSRPVMKEDERATIIASLKYVDLVVMFEEDNPLKLINEFRPDVIVKGGDYTPETVVGHEIVESSGGRVVIFPIVDGISTTQVIEQMKSQ